jgi:hypothetical protein
MGSDLLVCEMCRHVFIFFVSIVKYELLSMKLQCPAAFPRSGWWTFLQLLSNVPCRIGPLPHNLQITVGNDPVTTNTVFPGALINGTLSNTLCYASPWGTYYPNLANVFQCVDAFGNPATLTGQWVAIQMLESNLQTANSTSVAQLIICGVQIYADHQGDNALKLPSSTNLLLPDNNLGRPLEACGFNHTE